MIILAKRLFLQIFFDFLLLRFKRVVFNIKKSLLELQFEEKNPYTLITFFQPVYFIKNKTPAQVCSWEFLKTLTPHNFIKNEIF